MNKYQEALYEVSSFIRNNSEVVDGCFRGQHALSVLQELVDKATPKKAIEKHHFNDDLYCPNCESCVYEFFMKREQWCSDCGQKIDWSKEYE